ncbi:hypothetical protein [Geminocystis herdmanii]|uniref:hypothetical protein n=1 Tax=Geminocystis herdmanii TaxID=669359 RepID=UPI000382B9CD|nr:hypothetical protein [Geminocystis herdmanii]
MNQVINCQVNEQKITEIVEKLIDSQVLYQENLNRQEMIKVMKENFTPINVPDLNEISEDELAKRIKSLLSLYLVSGMLSDFTPEEMRIFDEAVKRGN